MLTDMWTKLRTLHRRRYDIIMLQETKLPDTDQNDDLTFRWKQTSNGEAYTTPAAASQSGGVAILISAYASSILTEKEIIPANTNQHRQLTLRAKLRNSIVYIHSIYAPVHRNDRPQFFNNLASPSPNGNHIIGGDFNCIMDAELDTIGDTQLASVGTMELTNWITTFGAVDAWRSFNNDAKEYTSPGGTARIDMTFVSGCFTNTPLARHAPRLIGSDHMCPEVTVASCNIDHKGGHWQLPIWLAPSAARRITPILQNLETQTSNPDYINIFTNSMKKITGKAKAQHKQVLRWRQNKIDRARLRWTRAHYRAIITPTDELINDAEMARQTWRQEIEDAGRLQRARAFDKHFEQAEKCTAFFLRRPKPNRTTIIPGVKMNDGTTSTDPTNIKSEHHAFWKKLYSSTSEGTESPPTQNNIQSLTNTNLPKITDAQARSLEAPIEEDEIVNQINHLPLNKAAGADGLRAELFRETPRLWARVLLPIFESAIHHHNSLPDSFKESVIVLIHKKGCTLQPGNYRPISLLNVMAKIISGIHNSRLRKVLDKVIPFEQTGFVPGRSISENIITIQDAIHYGKRNHPSTIILSLDFEKAYDRIQWPVMIAVLKQMGFGDRWLTLTSTLYKQRSARLSINGELSEPFPIERGVLQGDPLSPALFILTCSPLYAVLKEQQPQHGIPLPKNKFTPIASFYADDTNIIARSPTSAVALYNRAQWFCEHSGAKIHPAKCVAIATGPAPPRLSNGISIIPPDRHTTLLGVPMGQNISRQRQTEPVFTKMIARCKGWTHVGRTIEGKATVVNAMILSTLWYTLGALRTEETETKKVQSIINNFMHGSDQLDLGDPRAKGNINSGWFYTPKHLGGWGMTPILRTLRVRKPSLIRTFLTEKNNKINKPWHTIATQMLEEHTSNWCKDWSGILFWDGLWKQGEPGPGRWPALSPWWCDAWQEWIKLKLTPRRNSIPLCYLADWPIWNNRVLAKNHGIDHTLHRAFTNSNTRAHMRTIRGQGLLSFRDFITADGQPLSPQQLYTDITVRLSVNNPDLVVPRSACATLIRLVSAMWHNGKRLWLSSPSPPAENNNTLSNWHAPPTDNTNMMENKGFTKYTNKKIRQLVESTEPPRPQLKLIKINNTHATIDWKREHTILRQLAPSRRDLTMRILRNALPLGTKRIQWNVQTQTNCMMCDDGTTESAKHLFWTCDFATQTWGHITRPWRNHRRGPIGWEDILKGTDVRLGSRHGRIPEQLWAIIRGCTIRTLWFERNRRYFYAHLRTRSPSFRQHQALDDIKAHVESWIRRCTDTDRDVITALIHRLSITEQVYNQLRINTSTANNGNNGVPPQTMT